MESGETSAALARVAVCVCTRARPLMLRRCLVSLQAQQVDATRFTVQLVVVDNNPEPSVRPIYEEACGDGQWPGVLVHCPRPGIPIARNAALEAALGAGTDYIAFLDDDEVAPPDWLASLVRAIEDCGADAVQGGVRCLPAGGEAAAEAMAACTTGPASAPGGWLDFEPSESLATSNVLLRAGLVGPPLGLRFDETMQFTGGSDREFFMRAHKRGARLMRVYGIDVLEDAHEGRRSLAYQATRAYAAGSNYFARMTRNEPAPVAAARIGLRALERGASGLAKLAAAALLLLVLRRRAAQAQWRKGCMSLCFAAGCVTPVAGLRAHPYREIQGA